MSFKNIHKNVLSTLMVAALIPSSHAFAAGPADLEAAKEKERAARSESRSESQPPRVANPVRPTPEGDSSPRPPRVEPSQQARPEPSQPRQERPAPQEPRRETPAPTPRQDPPIQTRTEPAPQEPRRETHPTPEDRPGNNSNRDEQNRMDRAREIERQERDRLERAKQAERDERDRMEREQRDREQARRDQEDRNRRDEARRQQDELDRQERARQQAEQDRIEWNRQQAEAERIRNQQVQDQIAAQQAELARQAAELAAQREEVRREALRGAASVVFKNITRKTNGEWLRITLVKPLEIYNLHLDVVKAAVQIHEAIVYTATGKKYSLEGLKNTGTFDSQLDVYLDPSDDRRDDRIVAIDMRAESMGATSTLKVTVRADVGVPALKTTRFAMKK